MFRTYIETISERGILKMTEKEMLFCNNYEADYDAYYNMTLENIEEIYQSGRDYHYFYLQLLTIFEMTLDEILKSSDFTDSKKLVLISFAKEYWNKVQSKAYIAWCEYPASQHNDIDIFGVICN